MYDKNYDRAKSIHSVKLTSSAASHLMSRLILCPNGSMNPFMESGGLLNSGPRRSACTIRPGRGRSASASTWDGDARLLPTHWCMSQSSRDCRGRRLLTSRKICQTSFSSSATVALLSLNQHLRLHELGLPRLGLTTQARHRARPVWPSTRADCLARTIPDAAPRRLLRPSSHRLLFLHVP
jgi:hypothetical protein